MFGASRRELMRMLERERQRHDQRERELLDRLMLLAGRPWTLPDHAIDEQPPAEVYVSALDVLPEEWDQPAALAARTFDEG